MRYLLCFCLMTICSQLPAQQNKIYYSSGLLQYSYELKDGAFHGDFISYYDNGLVKAKGSFANNQKAGVWLSWDSSGMLRTKRNYEDDKTFDLLNEWTKSGCSLEPELLKRRNESLHTSPGLLDDFIYTQRYWKTLSPQSENQDLFADDFNKELKTGIEAGKIHVFKDDRFTNLVSPAEALTIMSKKPDQFLVKEQHSFSAYSQQMMITNLGLGLVYKEKDGDKILWLYCRDLFAWLKKLSGSFATIVDKFENNEFIAKMDMTTFQSPGFKPRKVEENEIIRIKLAEIDFEASAWIYLLDKELLANK